MKMKFCVSVVIKSGDKFLLVKDKEGKYNVVSGHIEVEDNSIVKAAQREIEEETGLDIDLERIFLTGTTTLKFGETNYHTTVFFTEVSRPYGDKDVKEIDGDEDVVSNHWMTIQEIEDCSRQWKNHLVTLKIKNSFLAMTGDPCFHYPAF